MTQKKPSKILLYGGKSTALIVTEMLKEKKIPVNFIYDSYLKKPFFKTSAKFSNKKEILLNEFIKKSNFFFVCIGMYDGELREYISNFFLEKKLKPFSITSKRSYIDKSSNCGHGLLAMPNSVVHKKAIIGNNCLLNVNSVIDHETIIGNGVHIMGSAYIAGRVKIEDYASIGANATILPDLTVGKRAIVGAGAVVTKNVKPGEIVAGNPARFLKKNKISYNFDV